MNVNPYLVIQHVLDNPKSLQDKLNELYHTGYELVAIWQGPGSYVTAVLIMKTAAAEIRNTLPLGAGQQNFGD
jgi:hypothetical protein